MKHRRVYQSIQSQKFGNWCGKNKNITHLGMVYTIYLWWWLGDASWKSGMARGAPWNISCAPTHCRWDPLHRPSQGRVKAALAIPVHFLSCLKNIYILNHTHTQRLEVHWKAIQVHCFQLWKMSFFTGFYSVLRSSLHLRTQGISSTCGQHIPDFSLNFFSKFFILCYFCRSIGIVFFWNFRFLLIDITMS